MGDAMGDHGQYGTGPYPDEGEAERKSRAAFGGHLGSCAALFGSVCDCGKIELNGRSLAYGGLHSSGPGPSYKIRQQARRTEHTGARLALARIDRERKRLAQEEERILRRPVEPVADESGDGPVVYFRKRFGNPRTPEGKGYQFVAVRVDTGKWFLSGKRRDRTAYTWEELIDFAESDETTPPVLWVASDWSTCEPGLQE